MNRRLLRNKRALLVAVLATILTGTYLMLVLKDIPGNVRYIPSPHPFEIAVASDEPTVRLSSMGLGLTRFPVSPSDEVSSGGHLWIHWSQSRSGTPKFAVAIPADMSFEHMLLESRKGIGSDWKETRIPIPESGEQPSLNDISLPGVSAKTVETEESGGIAKVKFKMLWAPLGSRSAGNHQLTIHFRGSLERHRYRVGLGRHKARLELGTNALLLKEVFAADQVLEPVRRASINAVVGLRYADVTDYLSLVDPVPDPHDVSEGFVSWQRPMDGREQSMGAQVTTTDERARFWAARGGEAVVLVLGALLGVVVEAVLEGRKRSTAHVPPTE